MFFKNYKNVLFVCSIFNIAVVQCFFGDVRDLATDKPLTFLAFAELYNVKAPSIKVMGAAEGTKIEVDTMAVFGSGTFTDIIAKQLKILGASQIQRGKIEVFEGRGYATIQGSEIDRALIAGACVILHSKIGKLEGNGDTDIDASTITEQCTLRGDATITDSIVKGPIVFEESLTITNNAIIQPNHGGITINCNGNITQISSHGNNIIHINGNNCSCSATEQTLRLQGTTRVEGPITFKSNKGTVYKGPQVVVTGTINGAEVINQPE